MKMQSLELVANICPLHFEGSTSLVHVMPIIELSEKFNLNGYQFNELYVFMNYQNHPGLVALSNAHTIRIVFQYCLQIIHESGVQRLHISFNHLQSLPPSPVGLARGYFHRIIHHCIFQYYVNLSPGSVLMTFSHSLATRCVVTLVFSLSGRRVCCTLNFLITKVFSCLTSEAMI